MIQKTALPPISVHVGHIPRIGHSHKFEAVVGVSDGRIGGEVMKVAFGFIFIIFYIYLSEHAHGVSPLVVLF